MKTEPVVECADAPISCNNNDWNTIDCLCLYVVFRTSLHVPILTIRELLQNDCLRRSFLLLLLLHIRQRFIGYLFTIIVIDVCTLRDRSVDVAFRVTKQKRAVAAISLFFVRFAYYLKGCWHTCMYIARAHIYIASTIAMQMHTRICERES